MASSSLSFSLSLSKRPFESKQLQHKWMEAYNKICRLKNGLLNNVCMLFKGEPAKNRLWWSCLLDETLSTLADQLPFFLYIKMDRNELGYRVSLELGWHGMAWCYFLHYRDRRNWRNNLRRHAPYISPWFRGGWLIKTDMFQSAYTVWLWDKNTK